MTQTEKNNERFKEIFTILDELSYVLKQSDNSYCQQKIEDASKILRNKITESSWTNIYSEFFKEVGKNEFDAFFHWLSTHYNVPTKK
jgi:F0F1-type ATP synthase membrane subunit b/b'